MGVCVGASVGAGVSVERDMRVSVNVGMDVKVSVEGTLVDVDADLGGSEAGVPPVLPRLQASVDNIRMRGGKNFEIFMA